MSSLIIDRIISQKNPLSAEEIQSILASISLVVERPQAGELTPSLRQLHMIAHGSPAFSGLPPALLARLIAISKSTDEAQLVPQILATQVLVECSPQADITLSQILPGGKQGKPPSHRVLPIVLSQDPGKSEVLAEFVPLIVRWLCTEGFASDLQIRSLDIMSAIATEQCRLLNKDQIHVIGAQMTEWLKHASLEQAPNPYSKGFFRKDQQPPVTEVDGTPSREFFTALCIGQYYTADQLLNIHTFSVLKPWLLSTQDSKSDVTEPTSPEDADAVERASLSSFSSWGGWGKLDDVSEASLQYCLRIIEQSERKSKIPQDFDLQYASLNEAVGILDHLCRSESTIVPKVFDVIKRLAGRPVALTQPRVMLAIIQFFFNHSEVMVYDATPIYETFFVKTLSTYYKHPAIAFETCLFLSDNLEKLCFDTNMLFRYFPNFFKLLAWNPRGLIKEFEELLPACMSPSTSMEIFHIMLDLPCLAAALEVQQKNQQSVPLESSGSLFQLLKTFNDAKFKPLFAFILRSEAGRGDTIDKIGLVHEVLFSLNKNPRVKMAASIVPTLLRLFFEVVLDECDCEFTNKVVPVMLERSCLLYGISSFQNEVKKVFSENILLLFKKHPQLLLDQCSEIQDFVGSVRNVEGREDFFIHMVWLVGEYLSPAYDSRCLPDVITSMYEALETMAYEIIGGNNSATPDKKYSPRLPSVLLSTIAKLAARSQDLIPRVLLCLTKLGHLKHYKDTDSAVLRRKSQELINILQLPNVAAEVLSPPPDIESGRWHTDEQSLQMVLRTASSFLQVRPNGIS